MKPVSVDSSFAQLTSTARGKRLFEQELLLVSATELISELMDEKKVTRADLAERIGKSKAFVTQLLKGRHNMTLRTLADLAWALDTRVQLQHDWNTAIQGHAHKSLLRPFWASLETSIPELVRSERNFADGQTLEVAA